MHLIHNKLIFHKDYKNLKMKLELFLNYKEMNFINLLIKKYYYIINKANHSDIIQ